ncbi:Uncharacterised protein [Mycoplasmopsis citelli]|uniref:Uncharacterized protein n=1 Tax=Mycoplasmopsis citelli TaxID=171281 RepID=A0A449B154_9BACT|nr:hypothetical protein [Mycoplasmopsis citelli]VEU74274.1 Uncharacterised protein [Mycoplasmopsis citelli]
MWKIFLRINSEISDQIRTVSFKDDGIEILKPSNFKKRIKWPHNRPLVVFYHKNNVYFLNIRSSEITLENGDKKARTKFNFEHEFINRDGEKSLADTSNIMVMKKDEFKLLYDESEINNLNQLNFEDVKQIISMLYYNFVEDADAKATYQKITLNTKEPSLKSEIIFSTVKHHGNFLDPKIAWYYNEDLINLLVDLRKQSKDVIDYWLKNNKKISDEYESKWKKNE